LLNAFLSDLDKREECTLSKVMDDMKLERVLDLLESRAAVQRNFNRLEQWADRNFMKLSKGKCKCPSLLPSSVGWGVNWLQISFAEKGLGDPRRQQAEQVSCGPWQQRQLSCINKSVANSSREVILLCSALLTSLLNPSF